MKLFNWVHRKLSLKDESSQNVDKDGDFAHIESDQPFPKENESFSKNNHMFGDWKGGILTIGTFGYHQLEDIENEQKSSDDFFSHEDDESDQMTEDDEEEEENEEMNHPLLETKNGDSDQNSLEDVSDEIKKERTTLADLFYADSVELDEKQVIGQVVEEKVKVNKKHGLSFSKKLVQEEASRPIQKLNRLMRKMLKRKIHPDVGLNKDVLNDDKVRAIICGVNETTSLLQDATI